MALRRWGRTPVIDVGTLARIKRGEIAVRPGIERFLPDGVRFTDGREERFQHVVLATGYRSDVGDFFSADGVDAGDLLNDLGHPAFVSGTGRLRGLHFLGFDAYSVGGLLRSIHRDSEAVARVIDGSG